MKKVLIVTYYWPPASGPGVQRWLKFAKYLKEFNWEPIILTVKNGSYVNADQELFKDIDPNLKVVKTKTIEPFLIYNALTGKKGKSVEVGMGNLRGKQSFFKKFSNHIRSNYFVPDARVGWNRYAIPKAISLVEEEDIDLVITTGPPHSTHAIGKVLKDKKSIPWIADFRDPWTSIYYEKYLSRSVKSKAKNEQLENDTIVFSDALLVVSEGMKSEFEDRCETIAVIPNGYDEDDMPAKVHEKTDLFKLSYIGNLKVNQNIQALWNALAELKAELEGFEKYFRLSFTGNVNEEVKQTISDLDISDLTEYNAFVKHTEAFRLMAISNLLYLPIPQAENNHLILTGKIFEYIASGSPVIGIGPVHGNASELLKSCNRPGMIDYSDKEGIKECIKDQFTFWKEQSGFSKKISDESYTRYTRKNITASLAKIMDDTIQKRKNQ